MINSSNVDSDGNAPPLIWDIPNQHDERAERGLDHGLLRAPNPRSRMTMSRHPSSPRARPTFQCRSGSRRFCSNADRRMPAKLTDQFSPAAKIVPVARRPAASRWLRRSTHRAGWRFDIWPGLPPSVIAAAEPQGQGRPPRGQDRPICRVAAARAHPAPIA